MKFLKKEMKRRIRVDRMLQEVSNRFNTECAGVALQQIPTITTYLAQDLTLTILLITHRQWEIILGQLPLTVFENGNISRCDRSRRFYLTVSPLTFT